MSAGGDEKRQGKTAPSPVIIDEVRDAAATAYYTWVMGRSEAARQRAQVAFTMVSFIVGAIVAAGLFGDIDREQTWVQATGIAALAAWLLAAGLLLHAAVGEVFAAEGQGTSAIVGRREFVVHIVQEQGRERNTTYDRLNRAVAASALAMILTAVAIGAAVVEEPTEVTREIVLAPEAVEALPAACRSSARPTLTASFKDGALDAEFPELEIAGAECGNGHRHDVAVRREDVLAVRR